MTATCKREQGEFNADDLFGKMSSIDINKILFKLKKKGKS